MASACRVATAAVAAVVGARSSRLTPAAQPVASAAAAAATNNSSSAHWGRGHRRGASSSVAAASSSSSSSSGAVEVITFDLDDTFWPTTPVVGAANQAFVDFCQERIPGFPDGAGLNEYMRAVRVEREQASVALGERHFPLSFASLRIVGAARAAVAAGFPETDAIAVASRGYHIAWIPERGNAAKRHLFAGVVESLRRLRAQYPRATFGTITNGLGSAAGAGLGEFFDFEISADALMDEMRIHGDDARKPAAFPFELAMRYARAEGRGEHAWSGDPHTWVHVGDDLLNDCHAAKLHAFRTIHIEHPSVVPYQPGAGGPGYLAGGPGLPGGYPGDPRRAELLLDLAAIVDAKVTSMEHLTEVLAGMGGH